MEQVIKINPNGSLTGLVHKKDGVNLTKLKGEKSVKRFSDIQWSDVFQQWKIVFLTGDYKGESAKYCHLYDNCVADKNDTMFFDDYDEAVKIEIKIANRMQKNGENLV